MKNIFELAREAEATLDVLAMGRHDGTLFSPVELERFAALIREAERERCAKVCDEHLEFPSLTPRHCAEAIRSLK